MSRRRAAAALSSVLAAFALAVVAVPAPAAVHTSRDGVALIKHFEGFPASGCPYLDPVGIPTRGFGRIEGITLASPCISLAEASRELRQLLAQRYEPAVRALFRPRIGVLAGLFNQHRFDSAVSLVYNLGVGAVQCVPGFETLCRAIRSRRPVAIGDAMLLYDKAGGRALLGLTLRRHAERALWLKPMAAFEMFRRGERALIRQYDRLRSHTSPRARRVVADLQRRMSAQAKRIRRTIRLRHDPFSLRRAVRASALERRAHHHPR